uniref:Inactive hydroxysteroid dehydrogenase-like protein 1 n=1 Tax=Culex pipiens TaxID=7175 RepID=A0A8D8I2P6_CULPI
MLESVISDSVVAVLAVLGIYATLNYLIVNCRTPVGILCNYFATRRVSFPERYGPWAVITGSSDGIGKQYAFNLAAKGMNVMLISRTESKLVEIAKEITIKYPVQVKWLAVDFSEGFKLYDKIEVALAGLDIGILVNNVGMAHEHPLEFDKICLRELEHIIQVNMGATVMMTRIVLPEMKRRDRGLVVNVSSSAGLNHLPYLSMYAATKAFLNSFSRALKEELFFTNVHCQLVIPMFVLTNINAEWETVWWWAMIATNVEKFTRSAVGTIGRSGVTAGYWAHEIQIALIRLMPGWLFAKMFYCICQPFKKQPDGKPVIKINNNY